MSKTYGNGTQHCLLCYCSMLLQTRSCGRMLHKNPEFIDPLSNLRFQRNWRGSCRICKLAVCVFMLQRLPCYILYTFAAFFFLQTRWAVYVERNIATLSRNHCCHRNATGFFACIVDLHVAVSNIKPFRDAL